MIVALRGILNLLLPLLGSRTWKINSASGWSEKFLSDLVDALLERGEEVNLERFLLLSLPLGAFGAWIILGYA